MASLVRSGFTFRRLVALQQPSLCQLRGFKFGKDSITTAEEQGAKATHTGQAFDEHDYRNVRFTDREKLVNKNWAVDLVAEDPIVVCEKRAVFSDGGGPLGHPRVFINLDPPEVQVCGYSGRRFIHKKYYKATEHGPSVSYEAYIKEMNPQVRDWPN